MKMQRSTAEVICAYLNYRLGKSDDTHDIDVSDHVVKLFQDALARNELEAEIELDINF